MNSNEIYKIVCGQIIRHFLTGLAALLGAYGISESQQRELVETTVTLAVALIVFLLGQGLSYLSKRNAIFKLPPNYEEVD